MKFIRLFAIVLLAAGAAWAVRSARSTYVMGAYVTSLHGRTAGQRINAERSATRLNGITIEPGGVLSFNRTVGPWTPDRGYVRALVSYDGELIVDWGGGVCQTSTTLYNAALLAGLQVVERHRHTWAPHYVAPGRDAAVAQRNIDLQFRNPYTFPVQIRARVSDASIGFDVLGNRPGPMASVATDTQGTEPPVEVVRTDNRLAPGRRRVINRGRAGVRVAVYRTAERNGTRELVSQDTYPVMNRIISVGPPRPTNSLQ